MTTYECAYCGYETDDPEASTGKVEGHKETVCNGCGAVRSFEKVTT